MIPVAAALLLLLAACSGDGQGSAGDRSQPPPATLIGENIHLAPGDDAARIGFQPAGASADMIVAFRPATARVSLCPLTGVDAPLPPIERCRRDVGSGVREPVSGAGMRAVGIVLEGDRAATADLFLEFDQAGREIVVRLPVMRAMRSASACEDNECNPFFELRPTRNGRFTASARWSGPRARLLLLQGRVLGRSFTATGVPYAVPADETGASPLRISGQMSAPGEYAVALRPTTSGQPLRDIRLEMRFP